MLGDRNLFAVELSAPRVLAAARELDAESARYADVAETVDGVMRQVETAISRLEAARNKIALAAGVLNAAAAVTSIGEPQTRLDSTLTMLSAIDGFVGGTVPRMGARIDAAPPAEALALAVRLRDGAVRILAAAGDFDPIADAVDDVKRLAADVAQTAANVADAGASRTTTIVIAVAVIAVVLLVRDLVR